MIKGWRNLPLKIIKTQVGKLEFSIAKVSKNRSLAD